MKCVKHFCEQILEIKEKQPENSADKIGREKETEKVLSFELQHGINMSPDLGERPDWIKSVQSSQTQIQTKTINGVTTETRTETIVKDGITTVDVYVNGELSKFIFKCDFIPHHHYL